MSDRGPLSGMFRYTRPPTPEVPLAMTPHLYASAALAALLFAGDKLVEPPLKSGPPVGAQNDRSGFRPLYVAGPSAGQRLCPV